MNLLGPFSGQGVRHVGNGALHTPFDMPCGAEIAEAAQEEEDFILQELRAGVAEGGAQRVEQRAGKTGGAHELVAQEREHLRLVHIDELKKFVHFLGKAGINAGRDFLAAVLQHPHHCLRDVLGGAQALQEGHEIRFITGGLAGVVVVLPVRPVVRAADDIGVDNVLDAGVRGGRGLYPDWLCIVIWYRVGRA